MFSYYVDLGVRALSRNPLVTGLIVILIAVGVASSITTFATLRAVSADPLPSRSAHLFSPQIDNRGPHRVTNNGDPDTELTYRDETALRVHHGGARQTAIYSIQLSAVPAATEILPFTARGYAVNASFFAMFAAPFQYGGAWSADADNLGGNEIVIGRELNDKIFHGANSVGREISLGGHAYRIAGILADWNPTPRFYAISAVQAYAPPPQIFLGFQRAIDLKIPTDGGTLCAFDYTGAGWDELLQSECTWISFWIELPTPADAERFRGFLTSYAQEQHANGRFAWPANIRLYNLPQWLKYMQVVPPETRISFVVALGLLLVCTVNTIGLLLARFMRRAPDIGVRRALGASQRAIYAQYLTEAGIVGLAGGALGAVLTLFFIRSLHIVFEPKIARIVHADPWVLGLAVLLAIAVSLLAATYPVWRASRIQPAWQLKIG
jgi:putative ABC transport system permease protein